MNELVLRVLRKLADGERGPAVHELLDEIEAAGRVPAAPAPQAPAPSLPRPVPSPFGGTQ
jgi:hypothetical protein